MKKIIFKSGVLLCLIMFSPVSLTSTGLQVTGNYVHISSEERQVLSFTEQGVVLFRRYEGGYTKTGVDFKSVPLETTWAPYISDAENSARALICQYGNPNRHCEAVEMKKLPETESILWSGKSFKKTAESFKSSRHDKGPFTFNELKSIFKTKMTIITPK